MTIRNFFEDDGNLALTSKFKEFLTETRDALKGPDRRIFMARAVNLLGKGGQRIAERELNWDRDTIRKGTKEMESGFVCFDNFQSRGRKPSEHHLPGLMEDINEIVEPKGQADPTFKTTKLYSPITAAEVRKRLIDQKDYSDEKLPQRRTISNKLNDLNFELKKVEKCIPIKKIPETDAIFENVHRTNRIADQTDGVVRISFDTKAAANLGPFSRKGRCRTGNKASDHDFEPELKLKPFGMLLPQFDETYFYFTKGNVTADFMADALEDIWPMLNERFNPHTLVLNADNGPENSSHRTQFIKRLVDFAISKQVSIELAYYPPYHSKYNPIERVWAVLENHWNGEVLENVEKALGLAKTMTWNGKKPIVKLVEGTYEKGVRLAKKTMNQLEAMINRTAGIENWAVEIPCYGE